MKVLIIGSGGREHALAWQCANFSEVTHVFVAPGNAGCALEKKISNIKIKVNAQNKSSSFGNGIYSNYKIIKSFLIIIFK